MRDETDHLAAPIGGVHRGTTQQGIFLDSAQRQAPLFGLFTLRRGLRDIRAISSPRICSTAASKPIPPKASTTSARPRPGRDENLRPFASLPHIHSRLGAQPVCHMINPCRLSMLRSPRKAFDRSIMASTRSRQTGARSINIPKLRYLPRSTAPIALRFIQLKTILQGVVARGTARAIASLSPLRCRQDRHN